MIVAIDYDGTIADTNREKVKWVQAELGKSISPWQCNRTDCVPIIGLEDYDRMGDYVYERKGSLEADEVPGGLAALHRLADAAELHVVTARPNNRMPYAKEWLEKQGALSCFTEFHSSKGTSKAAICSAIDANVLIDDDLRHVLDVDVHGLHRVLLQDGRPDTPECPGVAFCRSWDDVLKFIDGIR